MKRIIWHWTGGADGVTDDDKQHYHFIIDDEGVMHEGAHPISDNDETNDGSYAAHTKGCNKGSIGIAIDCMALASESDPWKTTKNPPTEKQVDALCRLTAALCIKYKIPISTTTTLNHGEVQANLNIAQRGKWDICRLPWVAKNENAGDWMRAKTSEYLAVLDAVAAPAAKEKENMDLNEVIEKARAAKASADDTLAKLEAVAAEQGIVAAAPVAAVQNVLHQVRTGIDLEPGALTSEMGLAKVVLGIAAGLATLFGVTLESQTIDNLVKLWHPLAAIIAVVIPAIFGFRTARKNANDRAKSDIAKAA